MHERLVGRGTFPYLRELEQTQWWPAERLRELQQDKLRRLFRHAFDKCPFYRQRINQAGLDPDSLALEQLPRLPTLQKAEIAEHHTAMIDPTVSGGLHRFTTGGSTGVPLAFEMDRARQAADQAARARSRRWFGIDVGEREAYLWGSPVEQSAQDRVKRVRDALTNHRLFNAFRMTPREMSRYLDELHGFDPVHLFGYPSSIARLVRHAAEVGGCVRNRSLRAVFVTGELFLKSDRAVIEEFFGLPVADGYGSREGGFIAHQCPAGSYHVTMESLIVELLDVAGRPAAPGEQGEITVTHLDAYGMPFIRYRTGDLARRSTKACSCGRVLESLERIEGRRTDMLRTAAGGYAHALSVIYVLRDEPAVREFKVVQRANLDLDVFIVARGRFDAADARRVQTCLKRQIGERIDVRIHLVGEVRPDPSGKHRHVVSEC